MMSMRHRRETGRLDSLRLFSGECAGDSLGPAAAVVGGLGLFDGGAPCGLPWLRLHFVAFGSVGCGPHPATLALPSWLASASATRTCFTGPFGVAAAAHSAFH